MRDERLANAIEKGLGERIRARRLAMGMSQDRLAELVGVTFQQVQKYEKGINRIAASRLYGIARALDLPISTLFEGLAGCDPCKNSQRASQTEAQMTADGQRLLMLFGSIADDSARRLLLVLAQAVAAEHKNRASNLSS